MNEDISKQRQQLITERLLSALDPSEIAVIDESHLHHKHQEAVQHGGGHFKLRIVSEKFVDKTELERHRMIYLALGESIGQEIHALSIKALTEDEQQTLIRAEI